MGGYSIFDGTIADMTWPEVDAAARKGSIMLVPVGVIEQHGPHLPLGTDIYGAHRICSLTKACLEGMHVASVIAPPYYFGINRATGMFPGSLNVSADSMTGILTDLFVDFSKHGFGKQFIINHHGDPEHNKAIFKAILKATEGGVDVVCVMRPSTERAYSMASISLPARSIIRLSANESDETKEARARLNKSKLHIHAEERETSLIMRWYPELLKEKEGIDRFDAVIPNAKEFEMAESGGKWRELSPLGYIGDPSVASEENAQLYAYEAADIANAIVNHLVKG